MDARLQLVLQPIVGSKQEYCTVNYCNKKISFKNNLKSHYFGTVLLDGSKGFFDDFFTHCMSASICSVVFKAISHKPFMDSHFQRYDIRYYTKDGDCKSLGTKLQLKTAHPSLHGIHKKCLTRMA